MSDWLTTERGKYSTTFALACEMERTRRGEKIYCRWYSSRYIVDNVFLLFFFFRARKNEVRGFYGSFSAPLFFLYRSVLWLWRGYICVHPHGRHTSRNRHGTMRMIRVVYEDYCYWLLPRLERSITKNRWQKIDDREIKIYVVSLSRNLSSITAHCRITS